MEERKKDMKRLSGGLILLNLTAISLGLTAGETDITDAGILEELTELRQFIDVNRDFSKGFKNLKPILIEYRSNASKFNGITQANLSFNTDALHMSIGANTIQADGKLLVITINVVYEYTDYVGYTIKSAKINAFETLANGDATFTGDVGIGGDLEVTGNAVLPSINGESNPSVKPIYYHPIYFYHSDETLGLLFVLSCCILDNNPNKYTRTTLVTKLKELMDAGALINVNGCARTNSTNDWSHAIIIVKSSSNYVIEGYTQNNYGQILNITDIEEFTEVQDGVNKIN